MKQKQKEVITETTEVITEKEWGIILHFWEHFPGLIPAIRQYIPYTGMISPEEIENECILILAEALIQCKSKKRCEKCEICEITKCEEYMRTLKTQVNTHMAKMKQTCRKYGVVSYVECNDSDNIATYKKYHSEHLYILPPQDDPQEQENEAQNEAQQEKIKKYLSRLTAKEKQIWELVLRKKSISEVAMIMGYRKPQGVRMAIRRSLAKIRLFAEQERQEK